jgi:putative tricarboxylic transport membrane protein
MNASGAGRARDQRNLREWVGGASAALLGIVVWVQSRGFPELPDGHPGPGLFPSVVGIGLFLAGALLIASALRPRGAPPVAPSERVLGGAAAGSARVAAVLVAVAGYPLLQPMLGFVPTIAAVCLLVALLLRARPLPAALTALGGTLLIYLLFTRLLGVPL